MIVKLFSPLYSSHAQVLLAGGKRRRVKNGAEIISVAYPAASSRVCAMKPLSFSTRTCLLVLALCLGTAMADVTLSPAQLQRVGQRIWQNECAGTVEGLTSWNSSEDFASLGIGHFIWYPEG